MVKVPGAVTPSDATITAFNWAMLVTVTIFESCDEGAITLAGVADESRPYGEPACSSHAGAPRARPRAPPAAGGTPFSNREENKLPPGRTPIELLGPFF